MTSLRPSLPARASAHMAGSSAASRALDLCSGITPGPAPSRANKKLPAFFFETAFGNQPVREWILGMDPRNGSWEWILGMDPGTVLGRTGSRSVGTFRTCVVRERMVLLISSQKTLAQDLKLARER